MSEERDDYSQETEWNEDDFNKEKYPEPIQEEEKKKKRRTILIIVFAITIPVVLAIVGIGFLIWGLIVGFTNCCNSCGACFNDCFKCSNDCNSCCSSCSSCTDSCDNCCGSSEGSTQIVKRNVQNGINLIKWYLYSFIEFLERIFLL